MKFEEAIKEAAKLSKEDETVHPLFYDETKTSLAVKSYPEYDDTFILVNAEKPLVDGFCLLTFEELSGVKWSVG